MPNNLEDDKWTSKIEELFNEKKLKSHQCIVYTKNDREKKADKKCGCQRLIRQHSFDGTPPETKPRSNEWNVDTHTQQLQRLIYHSTPSHKILRCACENKADIATLYELMRSVCDQPKLIISVYGGRKYFTMSEDIEKEFMDSLAEAAITAGTWIITTGLNNGAPRLIGEGIRRLRALTNTEQPTTLLGISWWGNVTQSTRKMVLDLQQKNSTLDDNQMAKNTYFFFDEKDSHSLERNHTHFLLLDDGKYQSEYVQPKVPETPISSKSILVNLTEPNDQSLRRRSNSSTAGSLTKQQHTYVVQTNKYPTEMQRSDLVDHACQTDACYAVTIIVEGGASTCVAVMNAILMQRPVIFIQGSGKIADIIASLLELTAKNEHTPARSPEPTEIEHNLRRFPMRTRTERDHSELIDQITEIMKPERPHFAQTDLFKPSISRDLPKPVDENFQKQELLKLAIKWNCFEQATDLLAELQYLDTPNLLAILFKQALEEDRPAFVDYFLRMNYDPRLTLDLYESEPSSTSNTNESTIVVDTDDSCTNQKLTAQECLDEYDKQTQLSQRGSKFVFLLYATAFNSNLQTNFKPDLHLIQPKTDSDLDIIYRKWIGSFMRPVFSDTSKVYSIIKSCKKNVCCYNGLCVRRKKAQESDDIPNPLAKLMIKQNVALPFSYETQQKIRDGVLAEEMTQAMLRDLLYWSVFTGRIDMAKVLILHIRTRICAALSCAAILRNRARCAITSDQGHRYNQQAKDFELYATDCINACYSNNERKACEILIRQEPLFGNITCLQVAIASRSKNFINTDCVSQVLTRVWYNKLTRIDRSFFTNLGFILSFFTLGLLAPFLVSYCPAEYVENDIQSANYQPNIHKNKKKNMKLSYESLLQGRPFLSSQLLNVGINYYTKYTESSTITWHIYIKKFKDFHQCPMVKMCYDFLSYIWLLLVFSYMLLFKLGPPNKRGRVFHWTEVYTIATISTMIIEDIRQNTFYYITYMRENQQQSMISRLIKAFIRGAPYSLFFIGIALWYTHGDKPSVFPAVKIILAMDLEMWYLWSLKFISVIKILSPKVFMARNMLRDLFGFLYVATICIVAYGVASRTMIKQSELTFTPLNIFENIFYAPYWFLYGDAQDEKQALDQMIYSNNTENLRTEAVATHVLLAFHMLFVSILLLNLLIAVFATTISKVENNAKYVYHYQRYILTQEYFEKPIVPIPPLLLVWYLCMGIRYIGHRLLQCFRKPKTRERHKHYLTKIFKMIPIDPKFTERSIAFEHAATYDYARRVVEKKKEKQSS